MIREHRRAVARTLRDPYGVGLSDLGGAVSWGEAKILIEDASSDPSTALGAELAGWAYRATYPELLAIVAQIGSKKAMSVMPWALQRSTTSDASPDEVAAAAAELEDGIVFS
jgi:hypothetical protein